MNRQTAINLVQHYAAKERVNLAKHTVINDARRFRILIYSTEFEYTDASGILIVRASINDEVSALRDDFIAIIPQLNERYRSELSEGTFEFDLTAKEVGKYPYGINLRRDFADAKLNPDDFYKYTEDLLRAAIRWRNKYYMKVFEQLNKARNAK